MNSRPQRLRQAATALALAIAALVPTSASAESTIFQTVFASDVIVTATQAPITLSPTAANWYVMASKDARSSTVNSIAGLRLTHTASTSGVVEAAARISALPLQLANVGDYLEVTGTFYTDNVLNVAFGLYDSGGVEPLVTAPNGTTLLANSGLNSTAGAQNGTINWKGYRASVTNTLVGTPAANVTLTQTGSVNSSVQTRKVQTTTPTYQAYDLISAGTGGYNAPGAASVGTLNNSATSVVWANGSFTPYNFTYRIQRSTSTAFLISYSIKDESNVTLFSATGTTTASDATPATLTQIFDSFAIGVRNSAPSYDSTNKQISTSPIFNVTALKIAGTNSDLARISVQPTNQSLIPNQSGSLSVTALGTAPLSYQWYKGDSPIGGATNSTYPIPSASESDVGTYTVVVSNAYGHETSASATVSISAASAPSFTTQPTSQTVDAGTTLTLTAEASGAPTPTYRWYKVGSPTPISGATSPTYTVTPVTTAHAGDYYAVASNSGGDVQSNVATVTVHTAAPAISVQPQPVTVNVGATINLSVTATGVPTPTYQWYKGGSPIDGATSSGYSITSATTANAGSYTVVVSNGIGSPATSDPALVTVNVVPPAISAPPTSVTVVYGNSTTLTAAYTGSLPRTYQWYKGDTLIENATAASYTISAATLADAGDYHVVVNNEANTPASSASATVSVVFANESTVFSTDFSTSKFHDAGQAITPTSTSWWVIASRTANTSTIGDDAATIDTVETRPLTIKFTTTTGSSVVETAARFTTTPINLATPGDYLRLTTTLTGKNLRYFCFGLFNSGGVNPFPLWGSPAADIIGTGTAANDIGTENWVGYRACLQATSSGGDIGTRPAQTASSTNRGNELLMPTNSTGSAFNEPAGVAIGNVPGFSSAVSLPDDAVFTLTYTIARSGTNQFTIDYQLYSGSSATGTPLYATGGTTTAAGSLPTEVTSSFDAVAIGFRNMNDTVIPQLTLNNLMIEHGVAADPAAPSFTTQPTGQTIAVGDTLTLVAAASGTPNPTYQWYKGTTPIDGATSATYTKLSATSGDSGSYKVVASNAVTDTTSDIVTVTVGSAASAYDTWTLAKGLTAANNGATQDPDGDGVNNLLEFALGGDPLVSSTAILPVAARSGANLTLTYNVEVAATADHTVTPKTTTDLSSTWTAVVHGTAGATIVETPVDADTDHVVVTIPASAARTFLRVEVAPKP